MKYTPFVPGDRVLVFDPSLFKDDISTPTTMTFQPATVECHYGCKSKYGTYPSLIDVTFDHNNKLSRAHFTSGVKYL